MGLFEASVKGTLNSGLLVRAANDRDVLWTPSVASKLTRGAAARRTEVALSHPDKIVGRYRDLRPPCSSVLVAVLRAGGGLHFRELLIAAWIAVEEGFAGASERVVHQLADDVHGSGHDWTVSGSGAAGVAEFSAGAEELRLAA